jgi:predicted regulator of amino acid metabolism with ACT domain
MPFDIIMWKTLAIHFGRYPSQARVAKLMLEYGLRVKDGRIFCGEVELADKAVGKAAGVDRRIVRAAAETIESVPELRSVYANLHAAALFCDVAPSMGWGTIEIIPDNAQAVGIVADVTSVVTSAGLAIRQVNVGDPDLTAEPRLYLVTERPVPPELIPKLKASRGVRSILIR